MINGDIKYFIEALETSSDIYIRYKSKKYFISGNWDTKNKKQLLYVIDLDNQDEYLWSSYSEKMSDNIKKFMCANIFQNNSFSQVQESIEWIND